MTGLLPSHVPLRNEGSMNLIDSDATRQKSLINSRLGHTYVGSPIALLVARSILLIPHSDRSTGIIGNLLKKKKT